MNNLIATFAGFSLALQDAVHGANGAMVMAFVEHRGVNRGRRRILKALLMKASQYGGAFGLIERPRGCRPHGRDVAAVTFVFGPRFWGVSPSRIPASRSCRQ